MSGTGQDRTGWPEVASQVAFKTPLYGLVYDRYELFV